MKQQLPYLPPTGWIREDIVLAHVPFGRTKLREEIAGGRFPAPKRFGERRIAYDAQAINRWIEEQRSDHVAACASAA